MTKAYKENELIINYIYGDPTRHTNDWSCLSVKGNVNGLEDVEMNKVCSVFFDVCGDKLEGTYEGCNWTRYLDKDELDEVAIELAGLGYDVTTHIENKRFHGFKIKAVQLNRRINWAKQHKTVYVLKGTEWVESRKFVGDVKKACRKVLGKPSDIKTWSCHAINFI